MKHSCSRRCSTAAGLGDEQFPILAWKGTHRRKAFDNLSCRGRGCLTARVTGGCLFTAARPVILNGIEDMVTRPDLADRVIMLTLNPITEAQRRPESVLWCEFEIARPNNLSALLEAAADGLRALPEVRLERLPRMADFALWATACETARWPPVSFEAAYCNNRRSAVENVIDADPVAAWVRDLMAERTAWAGTASDLLQAGAEDRRGNAIAEKKRQPP